MTPRPPASDDEVPDRPGVLDTEALMADLRRRVAEKKAQGLYGVDALMVDVTEDGAEPFGFDDLERLRGLAVQRVDIDVAASTKPVVGAVVSRLKRLLVRGASQPMYGLSAQATAFNGSLLAYLSALAREVSALERQVRGGREEDERVRAEVARLGAELTEAHDRVAAAEARVAHLADAALPERVARLERTPPATAGAATAPIDATPPPDGGDPVRLRLEATEDQDARAARTAAHAAALAGHGRVLHLGAGSGRGIDAFGSGAEGVESDAELVAAAAAAGRAVRHADPVAFVGALAPGSVGAVLVTELVERLDGRGLSALAAGIARALTPGGRVVVEGLHPSSAGGDGEFWRDAGRRRPLHPDAVRMALEGAGLGTTSVEILESSAGPRRYAVHAGR